MLAAVLREPHMQAEAGTLSHLLCLQADRQSKSLCWLLQVFHIYSRKVSRLPEIIRQQRKRALGQPRTGRMSLVMTDIQGFTRLMESNADNTTQVRSRGAVLGSWAGSARRLAHVVIAVLGTAPGVSRSTQPRVSIWQ